MGGCYLNNKYSTNSYYQESKFLVTQARSILIGICEFPSKTNFFGKRIFMKNWIYFQLFLPCIINAAYYCTRNKILCFRTTLDYTTNMMIFDVDYKSQGWVALGFGTNMLNAKMILAFTNEYGSPDISIRTSYSRSLPIPDSYQNIQIMTSSNMFNRNQQSFSFSVPADQYFQRGFIPMIYAYNMQQVMMNNIRMHNDYGFIPAIDLYQDYFVPSWALSHWESAMIHGLLMFLGWYLCCTCGIFVARYLKSRLGVWWFRVHYGLMVLTILLTIIAFVIVFMGTSMHIRTFHAVLGLLILIFSLLQGLLGIGIDRLFNPNRETIPWYDKAHWWLGRILYFLAIINIFLGINSAFEGTTYKGAVMGTFAGLVILIIALFGFFQKKISTGRHFQRETINLQSIEK